MDSTEILNQFFSGALNSAASISELEKNISDIETPTKLHESALSRYALGFIQRIRQYKNGSASEKDLCLNLRDLILVHGTLKVNDSVFHLVKRCGDEFGLVCESNNRVSCIKTYPSWLKSYSFVDDVYQLKYLSDQSYATFSVGDSLLSGHTRFHTYKSYEQKVAVHTALKLPSGFTLLISQPTGGGKSLVTQMLAATSQGLTLVIVPTVALALDQYYAASSNLVNKNGIFCYRGDQRSEERVAILRSIKDKTAKLLFSSPEAILRNTELFDLLGDAVKDNYLCNVVIDEAHVVPDWGVFFRPDFQLFSIVLRKWRLASSDSIRTFLLSATLSDDVVDTLFALFGSEAHNAQLRCDSLRQEPRFIFHAVKGKHEQDIKTIEAAKVLPKPMVIYVLEPREAKDLQKQFNDLGFKNIPCFTGNTKDSERDRILKGWKGNQYDIVIATSAFGIGVDKPDVRTIIHECAPENLSRFYQEVGRAGRDRLPSISLLMPYTSNVEGEGDLSRAFGLVNKRVLTVKVQIVRWFSMLHSASALVSADECILDTSVASSAMTDEQAEYAGNRNMAWNTNLLLFLHRTGFVSLKDVQYDAVKGSYLVTVKLLKPEILNNKEALTAALEKPRKEEYSIQTEGYRAMSRLISSPNSRCWGRAFRHLYPLAAELCNGCPCDPDGRVTTDQQFKVREKPALSLPPQVLSRALRRHLGSYRTLLVHDPDSDRLSEDELKSICEKADNCGIGALVIPDEMREYVSFCGLILTYDEFFATARELPFLFCSGVMCVFPDDQEVGNTLYRSLCKLDDYDYVKVIYCNDSFRLSSTGKTLSETIDGYTISLDKF